MHLFSYVLIPSVFALRFGTLKNTLFADLEGLRRVSMRSASVTVRIDGRAFELVDLAPVQVGSVGGKGKHFSGKVRGIEKSLVSLSVFDGIVEGFIDVGAEAIAIETVISSSSKRIVAYKAKDEEESRDVCLSNVVESTRNKYEFNALLPNGSTTNFNLFAPPVAADMSQLVGSDKPDDVTLTLGGRTECPIALIMDHSFYLRYGENALDYGLSLMNDVQQIYRNQLNVGLPVVYAHVIKQQNETRFGSYPDARNAVMAIGNITRWRDWPGFAQFSNDICAVHVLMNQRLSDGNGAAYVNTTCGRDGFNVGLTTAARAGGDASRATLVQTLAHELAHNFGANHDRDLTSADALTTSLNLCRPIDEFRYLLYGIGHVSQNMFKFSPCSVEMIRRSMAGGVNSACFVTKNAIRSFNTRRTDSFLWDECQNPMRNISGYIPNSFGCMTTYTNGFECTLFCANPNSPTSCYTFLDQNNQPAYKADGSICRVNYPNPDICWNGRCIPETRKVCDRSKACCDPVGNLRPNGTICRDEEFIDPCRLPVAYCDHSEVDKSECPIHIRAPGTPCGSCADPSKPETCSATQVCGSGANLGKCVASSDYAPLGGCINVSCAEDETCVEITGKAECVAVKQPTCKYFCDNEEFVYANSTASWGCDCKTDCVSRGSCCHDYAKLCLVTQRQASSTRRNVKRTRTTSQLDETASVTSDDVSLSRRTRRVQDLKPASISTSTLTAAVIFSLLFAIALLLLVVLIARRQKKKRSLLPLRSKENLTVIKSQDELRTPQMTPSPSVTPSISTPRANSTDELNE